MLKRELLLLMLSMLVKFSVLSCHYSIGGVDKGTFYDIVGTLL